VLSSFPPDRSGFDVVPEDGRNRRSTVAQHGLNDICCGKFGEQHASLFSDRLYDRFKPAKCVHNRDHSSMMRLCGLMWLKAVDEAIGMI
jgi:hypothetical protein